MKHSFLLFCICILACSSSSFEDNPLAKREPAFPAPEISAEGWPDAVPNTAPYIACDFSAPCDPRSGEFLLSWADGSAPSVQALWCDDNRRLMLSLDHLPPGAAQLSLSGYRSADGKDFADTTGDFYVLSSGSENEYTRPSVVSQIPRDQDFAVSPSLQRVAIRFDRAVDLEALEYELSDGGHTVPATLDRSARYSDLFALTLDERLAAENCYILMLTGIHDAWGNTLSAHILLFATAAEETQSAYTDAANHIVLSEICAGGYKGGSAADEFIELYNPGLECINLAQGNYRLYRASASGKAELLCDFSKEAHFALSPPLFLIPPQGFFLIANEGAGQELRAQADALIAKSRATLTANNSLWLTKNGTPEQAERIADLIGYGTAAEYEGRAAAPDPASGKSLERKARTDSTAASMAVDGRDRFRGNALDRDQNADDFCVRAQPEPQGSRSPYEDWSR